MSTVTTDHVVVYTIVYQHAGRREPTIIPHCIDITIARESVTFQPLTYEHTYSAKDPVYDRLGEQVAYTEGRLLSVTAHPHRAIFVVRRT